VGLSAFYAHTLRFRLIRVYRHDRSRKNIGAIALALNSTPRSDGAPCQPRCNHVRWGFMPLAFISLRATKYRVFVKARSQMPGISKQISTAGAPSCRSSRVSPKHPRASERAVKATRSTSAKSRANDIDYDFPFNLREQPCESNERWTRGAP
jgi:hypothetical protein